MLTVSETLEIESSFLNSKGESTKKSIINSLSLNNILNRRIGDRSLGSSSVGLSGGERRRLSCALEMLSSPLLILSDEPTTGLDSSQAHKVVKKLREVAVENRIPVSKKVSGRRPFAINHSHARRSLAAGCCYSTCTTWKCL